MSELLKPLIEKALSLGGHDVHIKSSFPPVIRVANAIKRLDYPPFSPNEMEKLVAELLDPKQTSIFRSKGQVDFSLEYPEMCRIRANAFFQRNSIALSLRLIPPKMPSIHEVGIADTVINDLLKITRGMILITGATSSGKSTTIASFINHLASADSLHIVTIEDPIEYVLQTFPQSIISQRKVHEISSILKLVRRTGCIPMSDNIAELIKSGRLRLSDVPQEYRPEK